MKRSADTWLLLVLLLAAAAIVAWWLRPELRPATVDAVDRRDERSTKTPGSITPAYPVAPPASAGDTPGLTPLPPLEDSDAYFALALVNLFGSEVGDRLTKNALIEKFVVTIDNLPRQHVAERMRPVGGLGKTFIAEELEAGDRYLLGPDNYSRYVPYVMTLTRANLDELVGIYRRFYPLFQQAYVSLGYPDGYFNDRVVDVIDHLLDTPEPVGPLYLHRPHVLFEFVDPELEALSSGQKLMLRIGPENAAQVRNVLAQLRSRLASAPQ